MGTRVTITVEVADEYADPEDSTGLTEEAYLDFTNAVAVFGDIVSGPDLVSD